MEKGMGHGFWHADLKNPKNHTNGVVFGFINDT